MAKKRAAVSLRKPSPAPDTDLLLSRTETTTDITELTTLATSEALPAAAEPMSIEAFVSGAAAAIEKAVGEVPQARLLELLERGPAGYRELTVYLPEQLSRDLSLFCMERNLDLNRLVAGALEQHLSTAPSRFDKHRIAALARALVIGLRRRARVLWRARRNGWLAAARRAVSATPTAAATG